MYKLAEQLLDKHDEDWDAAIEEAIHKAITDPDIFEEYTKPLLENAIRGIVRTAGAARRSKIFNSVPTCPKGQSGESLQKNTYEKEQARTVVQETAIMEMWLNKCKKKLRDAMRSDLAQEVNMFNNHARWNEKRRSFLNEIYQGLENGDRVQDKFTNAQLEAIKQKVHRKVDSRFDKLVLEEGAPALAV